MSAAQEQKLVEALPIAFFPIAKHDATLAIALKSQHDLIEDGLYAEALKLNDAIVQRLELLVMKQTAATAKETP